MAFKRPYNLRESAVKAEAALEGCQRFAGDLTCNNWPITGQEVYGRTIRENTWKKIHMRTHHSENYTLVTVLHQCRP